jgi:NADH-quinone oxidoreductase subunit G
VDICPVGALLSRDYRFRARSWFQSAAPSVCTGCSRGCNIYADFMGQETYRYRPRENEAINKSWLCDQGRLTYKGLNLGRVLSAVVGRQQGGTARPEVARQEALQTAARELTGAKGKALAVLASPVASNEDLLAALTFAKGTLGAREVYVGGRPEGQADHFLMTADKNPNRKGLELIAQGLGLEVPGDVEAFAQAAAKLDVFVAQATNESALTAQATVLLPASAHVEADGSFVQVDGHIQRFRKAYPSKGEAVGHWALAAELTRQMGGSAAWTTSREAFRELGKGVPEFVSFDWDKAAPPDREKPGINPLAAAADGRPPGYREFGAPRVRGL